MNSNDIVSLIDCDKEEAKEILVKMINNEPDFFTADDTYRFINEENIDEIQRRELLYDKYVLGCFVPSFIADICGLDVSVVEKAQKDESFELLGELMSKHIDTVQREYANLDGYGHHFAHYDGQEEYLNGYYIFKVN